MTSDFPTIRSNGTLRPSQSDVVRIAKQRLAEGHKTIHVVAPPGSGKTVLGLYLWAECIRLPALVLSPNSAIQAQWTERLDLFDSPRSLRSISSTDSKSPKLFTSLTYQLSFPNVPWTTGVITGSVSSTGSSTPRKVGSGKDPSSTKFR